MLGYMRRHHAHKRHSSYVKGPRKTLSEEDRPMSVSEFLLELLCSTQTIICFYGNSYLITNVQ